MNESSEEFNINVAHSDTNINIQQDSHSHNESNPYIPNYSLPGIIHFLEHQWRKFEIERSQWEIEKAELNSKISFLQGERRGQENLKKDMIRRIKMLEYALKQERAKHQSQNNGQTEDNNDIDEDLIMEQLDDKDHLAELQWKQGRHLLKQYLQEIGYADNVIDARTQRVRTLLGFASNNYMTNSSDNILPIIDQGKNMTTPATILQNSHVDKPSFYTATKLMPANNKTNNQSLNSDNWDNSGNFNLQENFDHPHQNFNDHNLNKAEKFPYQNMNFNKKSNILNSAQKSFIQDINSRQNNVDSLAPKAAPPYSSILKKHGQSDPTESSDSLVSTVITVGNHNDDDDGSGNPVPRRNITDEEGDQEDVETEEALSEFDFLSANGGGGGHNTAPLSQQQQPRDHHLMGYGGLGHDEEDDDDINEGDGGEGGRRQKLQRVPPQYGKSVPEQYHNGPTTNSKRLINSKGTTHHTKETRRDHSYPAHQKQDMDAEDHIAKGRNEDFDEEYDVMSGSDKDALVLNNILGALADKGGAGKRQNFMDNAKIGNLGGNKFPILGDLADISVSNEEEKEELVNNEVADIKASKTWNTKLTLKGHLDAVRCIVFHPTLPLILSASEDQDIKLWNLEKNITSKKLSSDIEAIATFRKHSGPVLCIAYNSTGEYFVSGGLDAALYCWKMPILDSDQCETLNESSFPVLPWAALSGAHTDAIWAVKIHPVTQNIFTCSADGSVLVWEVTCPNDACAVDGHVTTVPPPRTGKVLARLYPPHVTTEARMMNGEGPNERAPPLAIESTDPATCMDFTLSNDSSQLIVSYASSTIVLYDVNTLCPLLSFKPEPNAEAPFETTYINYVISHPTRPVTITAHDDKCIRFFENATGKCLHTMVAHLDAVSCLAIDPYGLYLLSGSHDTSLRLWDYDKKSCVQEITCHRKKFDEAVNTVSFHPTLSFIASGGADGIIKVYV